VPVYEVVPVDDIEAVKNEVTRQLASFRRLVGKDPTHIDSHQHVHLREPARSALVDVSCELHVPLRHLTPGVHYCGNFYGQTAEGYPFPDAISVEGLLKILTALPIGFTELGCHPGAGNDLNTMYRNERERELETLCDSRVRATIKNQEIELRSFRNAAA